MTTPNKTEPMRELLLTTDLKQLAEELDAQLDNGKILFSTKARLEIILSALERAVAGVESKYNNLKRQVDQSNKDEELRQIQMKSFEEDISIAQADLANARKDSERLDWLDSPNGSIQQIQRILVNKRVIDNDYNCTFRQAIDAAMSTNKGVK
jgi:hypothetical protein